MHAARRDASSTILPGMERPLVDAIASSASSRRRSWIPAASSSSPATRGSARRASPRSSRRGPRPPATSSRGDVSTPPIRRPSTSSRIAARTGAHAHDAAVAAARAKALAHFPKADAQGRVLVQAAPVAQGLVRPRMP